MINTLFALLLPSFIGLNRYGQTNDFKEILERYFKSVLFVNLICYVLVIYLLKKPQFTFTNQFTLKYSILAIIIAYVLPIVHKFIISNINVDIRVEKNETKNK